ncbi:LysR family transcriptional regulator [Sulfoacidibacillus thermotolerans]|uniref:LysR family transcriptional regulator n=1 Tax=Sulfoacidibacillus thermotolerans TaxID=1765684 RepID=A0A2U3D876_SULT2|nr:LysR family transcriptional regulator [Sulfoacidibacillus thermotolerans]PWI57486.1 LysR family transcriptional regulator [Sulfoacidibacillus thermotolerans]
MDIRQLRYFVTIAKEGQITRAAQKLNMAQPPLSQQLRLLEQELATELIERKGRSIELTEAGRVLYHKGEQLLHHLEDIVLEVKETGEGIRGVLSIGIVISCLAVLPQRLVEFRGKYPSVYFKIREGDTSTLSMLLKNRSIELAIVRLPLSSDEFSLLRLPDEPYVLLSPVDWKITESSVKLRELAELPMLLLHRISGSGQFELIVNECRKAGFEPHAITECADPTILITLVAAGLGATIIPKSTVSLFPLQNIRMTHLEDFSVQSEAAVIWLKDRYLSKPAERFIEMFATDGK